MQLSDMFELEYDPASQRAQAVAEALEKEPAIHCVQMLEPNLLEIFPASHTLHVVGEVNPEPETTQSIEVGFLKNGGVKTCGIGSSMT